MLESIIYIRNREDMVSRLEQRVDAISKRQENVYLCVFE